MNKNRGVIPGISLERIRLIMKKTLSIVLALVMVLAFAFPTFATTDESTTESTTVSEETKPTDPAELGAYYAELLNAEDSDPAAIGAMIVADFQNGLITIETLPAVLEAFAANSTDAAKLAAAFTQIEDGLASMGITIPGVTLPDENVTLPDEVVTLPDDGEDDGESDSSDFLNTILGILGSIGDMIFGGGSDNGGDGTTDDDQWEDDTTDDTTDEDDLVPDTGDTTVVSVAAVALVAGAALVLTRKKSDDAE